MAYTPAPDYGTTGYQSAYNTAGDKQSANIGVAASQPSYQNGSLEEYAKAVGVYSGLTGSCGHSNLARSCSAGTDPASTAYDTLEFIARHLFENPHNPSANQIQILAAFVLGYNSKQSR